MCKTKANKNLSVIDELAKQKYADRQITVILRYFVRGIKVPVAINLSCFIIILITNH